MPNNKRTCVSHKDAQFICISPYCSANCSYICSLPKEKCKQDHQTCQLISISYLLKQSSFILKKQKQITNSNNKLSLNLQSIIKQCTDIVKKCQNIIKNKQTCQRIINVVDTHGLIQRKDKQIIYNFVKEQSQIQMKYMKQLTNGKGNTNIQIKNQNIINQNLTINWLQRAFIALNIQISQYLKQLKQKIPQLQLNQNLKGPQQEIDKLAKSSKGFGANNNKNNQKYNQKIMEKINQKVDEYKLNVNQFNVSSLNNEKNLKQSPRKQSVKKQGFIISASNLVQSPQKSNLGNNKPMPVKNAIIETPQHLKHKQKQKPIVTSSSNIKKNNPSSLQNNNNNFNFNSSKGFQPIISNIIRNHIPIGPLFSKITNDIETINTFFYEKFSGAELLYRASQNNFSAIKFHQKCDGHKNTLTILITQNDKIIGGFTPLQWRSYGDFIQDPTQATFIFNLTSGQRYPLLNRYKAIWCSQTYGPSFGYPDLQIADKANLNQNSCANFPQAFNNGNYVLSPGSINMFCGTKTGHFKIKQWEVYELKFTK